MKHFSIPILLAIAISFASCERALIADDISASATNTFDYLWQRFDQQYALFDVKDVDWQAVYDTSQTLPFFAQKRLLIIENSGKFKAGKSGGEEGESSEKTGSNDLLERIVSNVPETTCLAFFEENAAKNKRIFKLIAKNGNVCECGQDTEEVLIGWLARGFSAAGKKVRKSTLELLTGRVGLDYDLLRREFEKIVSFVGDREVIEDADILAISSEVAESRIFDMLQAMCEKNTRKVLVKYRDLLANREAPLYILAMLRMQLPREPSRAF